MNEKILPAVAAVLFSAWLLFKNTGTRPWVFERNTSHRVRGHFTFPDGTDVTQAAEGFQSSLEQADWQQVQLTEVSPTRVEFSAITPASPIAAEVPREGLLIFGSRLVYTDVSPIKE